jgi:hypothetical protein
MIPLKLRRVMTCILVCMLLTVLMPAQATHAQEIYLGAVDAGNSTCGVFYVNAVKIDPYLNSGFDLRLDQTIVRYGYVSYVSTTSRLDWTKLTGTPGSGTILHWEGVQAPNVTGVISDFRSVGSGQLRLTLSGTFTAYYFPNPSLPYSKTCNMSSSVVVNVP